jgi:hypothetical protein
MRLRCPASQLEWARLLGVLNWIFLGVELLNMNLLHAGRDEPGHSSAEVSAIFCVSTSSTFCSQRNHEGFIRFGSGKSQQELGLCLSLKQHDFRRDERTPPVSNPTPSTKDQGDRVTRKILIPPNITDSDSKDKVGSPFSNRQQRGGAIKLSLGLSIRRFK